MEIDVDELVTKELEKRDRKIKKQSERINELEVEVEKLHRTLTSMSKAKDALLEAADWLDPYRYEDEL
jgi:cell division protein FtsL